MGHISLIDFFSKILPNDLPPHPLEGTLTALKIVKSGALVLESWFVEPPACKQLCLAEEWLEDKLGVPEVIVSQPHLNPAQALAYTASLRDWLIRHLRNEDALSASFLQRTEFEADEANNRILIKQESRLLNEEGLGLVVDFMGRYLNSELDFCLLSQRGQDILDYAGDLCRSHDLKANRQHETKPPPVRQRPEEKRKTSAKAAKIWGRIKAELKVVAIDSLNSESGLSLIEGDVFALESRPVSNNTSVLIKFNLTDLTSSLSCILFVKPELSAKILDQLADKRVAVAAEISYDAKFSKDLQGRVVGIQPAAEQAAIVDNNPEKRIELHAHTKMSARDALCSAADLVIKAADLGHPAVAITDHGVVQAFPEAAATAAELAAQGKPVKVIYGLEGYLVDDGQPIVFNSDLADLEDGFVAIDVETTGLNPAGDRLIEIGAVHFTADGSGGFQPGESLSRLVDPGIAVSPKSESLTGITTQMLSGAPAPLTVLKELIAWIGDRPVVGHNVFFDVGFLRYEGFRKEKESDPAVKFNPPLIDTLALARWLLPQLKSHRLADLTRYFEIPLDQAHRAFADALATGQLFSRLWQQSKAKSLTDLNRLAGVLSREQVVEHRRQVFHVVLLAKDLLGLYHLYRLVSSSHLDTFHQRPRIPRSLLTYFRDGLLIGGACERGEIFQQALSVYKKTGLSEDSLQFLKRDPSAVKLARFYDYFEIQPIGNNAFYLRDPDSGLTVTEDLKKINQLIFKWGQNARKPVCATCDVHYLEEHDLILRQILMADVGYKDADEQADLSYKTTARLLEEFSYLGEKEAKACVVDNPARIARLVENNLKPFPEGFYPIQIAESVEAVESIVWSTARDTYAYQGEIHPLVRRRVERELNSIIANGFAVMYYIAHRVVSQSNRDGYIVGSRGSVGSSLVATFCGITEVNPLAPHTVCPACHFAEFDESGQYGSGYDLPETACPQCGQMMHRDGQDIPFETFLGFDGDKQPDIDLNFSGEYQPRAHRFIEEMFGREHTYRAGTISSYAAKNAQAIVRSFYEDKEEFVTQAEIDRLARGLIGVKRTTGQHPGGIVVVPKEREIYDFTPVQHPADRSENGTVTTHFDFNALHETILKLDILGHDDPTMLKMLGDLTGVDVLSIPMQDEKVMSLFNSTKALGILDEDKISDSATLGLPEMGTFMARDIIREAKPGRFYDLVQMMGLSHGTGVWKGNAQDLIRAGTCTIEDVIGCRDSIMTGLIYSGLPSQEAFTIMERVRRGRSLTAEQEKLMRQKKVPQWYIESCQKIRYLFPKAHAVAYTISSLRIAWFKVYHPEAYYCSYFSVRADEFDSEIMCLPLEKTVPLLRQMRRELFKGSDRDKKIYYILELVVEMQLRGIAFLPIDLYRSDATRFTIVKKGEILPPLRAIPSVSTAVAAQIVAARQDGVFKSQDELMRRAAIGPAVIEKLSDAGCLSDLPATSQLDFFDML